MKRTIFAIVMLAGFSCALSDTVLLTSGGELHGVVEDVVLFEGGKETSLVRGQFSEIALGVDGSDSVRLTDGTTRTTNVVAVRLRSGTIGTRLVRSQLKAVKLGEAAEADLRKEYEKKRSETGEDDAGGLCQLALWCQRTGLKEEARHLAEESLKLDPGHRLLVEAHRILGHELPADARPLADEADGLYQAYLAKSDGWDAEDLQHILALAKEVRDLDRRIEEFERLIKAAPTENAEARDRARERARREAEQNYGLGTAHYWEWDVKKLKQELLELYRQRSAQLGNLGRQKDELATLSGARKGRLAGALDQIHRALWLGESPSHTEMKAFFSEAFGDARVRRHIGGFLGL